MRSRRLSRQADPPSLSPARVNSARTPKATIQFLRGETAAAASEYAAIFAVLVIALMVCVSVVGRNLGRAVHAADTKLAGGGAGSFFGGPAAAGGPAASAGGKSKSPSPEKGPDAAAYAKPLANRTRGDAEVKDKSPDKNQAAPDQGIGGMRRIFKRGKQGPTGQR